MSIIANALKKAQKKRVEVTEEPAFPSPTQDFAEFLKTKAQEKKKQNSSTKTIIISIILAVALASLIALTFFLLNRLEDSLSSVSSDIVTVGSIERLVEQGKIVPVDLTEPAYTGSEPLPVLKKELTIQGPEPDSYITPRQEIDELPISSPLVNENIVPVLNGIMYSPVSPQAVINGEIYLKGESINGYKIKEILQNKVIFTKDNKDTELTLR